VTTWIEREKEHRRLTLEALTDVDAGRVIDHVVVTAWADNLDTDSSEVSSCPPERDS
jgi:hypothetical protein